MVVTQPPRSWAIYRCSKLQKFKIDSTSTNPRTGRSAIYLGRYYQLEECHQGYHYSAIFFPATPDWGYQNCRTCVLCLEHRVPAGCAWRTCPRGDCSTRVPIDLACGLLFAVCVLLRVVCGLRLEPNSKACGPTIFVENQQNTNTK